MTTPTSRPRGGRSRVTSHSELTHVALTLFFERGFDQTTVDDIVSAAGIGRRTFFRYFSSKNDLPWGEFDALLERMRQHFACMPPDLALSEALRQAILEFNRYPDDELHYHRERMWLLLNVPSLVAHSTLRYAAWRQVVADYVAQRWDEPADALGPQAVAGACLGLCLAAYDRWLCDEDSDLVVLLDESFAQLSSLFADQPV
ncbi:MAG: mycofactocin system transcriptional regulator [Beutenbergiaceae bacterium]